MGGPGFDAIRDGFIEWFCFSPVGTLSTTCAKGVSIL